MEQGVNWYVFVYDKMCSLIYEILMWVLQGVNKEFYTISLLNVNSFQLSHLGFNFFSSFISTL